MEIENIEIVAVVGAGTMGSGIAQVFAEEGFFVYLFDETYEKSKEGKEKIKKRLEKKLKNAENIQKDDPSEILRKIMPMRFNDLELLRKPQFVVEAIFEDIDAKKAIFRKLDELCDPKTILATNTSSISIHKIAEAVSDKRKPNVIGMHFMNPPYALKLLEIIRSDHTSDETYALVCELAKKLGREPSLTSADVPGFTVNGNLMPSLRHSLICLEQGIANIYDIDKSIMLGVGGAMGPMSLGDLIGWDIVFNILNSMYEYYGEYSPPKILFDLVKKKYLGKKTKKGIFEFVQEIRRNENENSLYPLIKSCNKEKKI
jgi:3-hydroxybutyryl-CoA dehydrogenase